MAITFYCGSGSPFAWRVWFVLEHKRLPYDLKVLSFGAGDHKKADYLAINPRGKLPALVHDGVALYESSAIVEYLEDTHPEPSILPGDAAARGLARRIAAETDAYLFPAVSRLVAQTLFKPGGDGDPAEIIAAKKGVVDELARFEAYALPSAADYFAGNAVSLADFALYPMLGLVNRVGERQPANAVAIPPRIAAWSKRMEALPYFGRTVPPHWKHPVG